MNRDGGGGRWEFLLVKSCQQADSGETPDLEVWSFSRRPDSKLHLKPVVPHYWNQAYLKKERKKTRKFEGITRKQTDSNEAGTSQGQPPWFPPPDQRPPCSERELMSPSESFISLENWHKALRKRGLGNGSCLVTWVDVYSWCLDILVSVLPESFQGRSTLMCFHSWPGIRYRDWSPVSFLSIFISQHQHATLQCLIKYFGKLIFKRAEEDAQLFSAKKLSEAPTTNWSDWHKNDGSCISQ